MTELKPEYFNISGWFEFEPTDPIYAEKRMWGEVLIRAFTDAVQQNSPDAWEAREWIFAELVDDPPTCSFQWIMEAIFPEYDIETLHEKFKAKLLEAVSWEAYVKPIASKTTGQSKAPKPRNIPKYDESELIQIRQILSEAEEPMKTAELMRRLGLEVNDTTYATFRLRIRRHAARCWDLRQIGRKWSLVEVS